MLSLCNRNNVYSDSFVSPFASMSGWSKRCPCWSGGRRAARCSHWYTEESSALFSQRVTQIVLTCPVPWPSPFPAVVNFDYLLWASNAFCLLPCALCPCPPMQVNMMNSEHNPDLMLMAARALTFLADVLPVSATSIVRHGAVPAFCARLLTIEYIDLAEQSLQVGGWAARLETLAPRPRIYVFASSLFLVF